MTSPKLEQKGPAQGTTGIRAYSVLPSMAWPEFAEKSVVCTPRLLMLAFFTAAPFSCLCCLELLLAETDAERERWEALSLLSFLFRR